MVKRISVFAKSFRGRFFLSGAKAAAERPEEERRRESRRGEEERVFFKEACGTHWHTFTLLVFPPFSDSRSLSPMGQNNLRIALLKHTLSNVMLGKGKGKEEKANNKREAFLCVCTPLPR